MKQFTAVAMGLVLIGALFGGLNWIKTSVRLAAQETSDVVVAEPAPNGVPVQPDLLGQSGHRPFPTYFIDDIVARLTGAVETLLERKQTKNSDDLRKHLDRVRHVIKLPRPFVTEVPPQELYRRASESVFLVAGLTKPKDEVVDWKTAFSTAFVIHEDGILSTSAHVFDHDDQDDAVVVMDIRGRVYPVQELLAADKKADTAIFRIDVKGLTPLPLGQEVAPGTPIRVIGHPGDSFFFFSAGHLANYERDDDGAFWLNVTADFGQGSSGGPVMDAAGNVVGQVSRTFTLYAGGEATNRRRRHRRSLTQAAADPLVMELSKEDHDPTLDAKKKADPQMVFKACTPVSAIRALVQ